MLWYLVLTFVPCTLSTTRACTAIVPVPGTVYASLYGPGQTMARTWTCPTGLGGE